MGFTCLRWLSKSPPKCWTRSPTFWTVIPSLPSSKWCSWSVRVEAAGLLSCISYFYSSSRTKDLWTWTCNCFLTNRFRHFGTETSRIFVLSVGYLPESSVAAAALPPTPLGSSHVFSSNSWSVFQTFTSLFRASLASSSVVSSIIS